MLKNFVLNIILFFVFSYSYSQTIVSTIAENKNAIVEESTGIHCSYCPDGHAILNQLIEQNPNDIFVIKFHEGGYAWDCDPNGGHDFNNAIANQLGVMGQANGQPSASVNRQIFSSYSMSGGTAMSRGYWTSAITQVIQENSYVNIGVDAEIIGNQLIVHVEAYYTADSPQDTNYINIAILQNETIGPQLGGIEFNPNYVTSNTPNSNYQHGEYDYRHMNRLVDMINGLNGDAINQTTEGTFIDRYYYYNLPSFYNDVAVDLNEIDVIAFISDGNEIQTGYKSEATYTQFSNDIGVGELLSPTGISPSSEELLTVSIINTGTSVVSNFDISYQINNGEIITESWSGNLESGQSVEFTFEQSFDLTVYENSVNVYVVVEFPQDEYLNNNTLDINLDLISYCPVSMDCSYGDGFQYFSLADIQNSSGCEGYADFTNQSTELNQGETYALTVTTGYGDQYVRVWIDYNDDNEFTLDELIIDNWIIAVGSASGSYNETIEFSIPNDAPIGNHILRAKTNWQAGVPDDACEATQYGETEDYSVQIVESLGLNQNIISKIDYYYNNNVLHLSSNEILEKIQIFDLVGKKIKDQNINDKYYELNLSSLESSIYFVTVKGLNKISTFKLLVR